MDSPAEYAPFSPEFKANPYPFYARLRADQPIYRTTLPDGRGLWLVMRYDDAIALLKDPSFVKDRRNALTLEEAAQVPPMPPSFEVFTHNMLDQDPPNYTRLRALVSQAFTPRLVQALRPRIQQIADGLLDIVQDRGELDLIDEYAFPLPITVIAELLGVPAADRDLFREWSDAVVSGDFTAESAHRIAPQMEAFATYLRALFDERRRAPENDLVSALLLAEEAGDRLSEDELFGMLFLLLVAGHETTVNLIGNGTLALLQHPDQLERLRRDPELITPLVEELLRYSGPVESATERYAREAVELDGVTIPRGERVLVMLASANRDGTQFANPDRLDLSRDNRQHLAFGHGIHYCLGAPLARLEGQIAINTLVRRIPNLRLKVAPAELAWRPGIIIRGLGHLPVAL